MSPLGVAVGAPPKFIAVTGPDVGEPRLHVMEDPFALVGRSNDCDIHLVDAGVSYRHAYLQVIGSRVLCIDLCSRTGVIWDEGPRPSDWLLAGRSARIGPYRLSVSHGPPGMSSGGEENESSAEAAFNPLETHAAGAATLPKVHLEALDNTLPQSRWSVDRMLTLVGRSEGCSLRLPHKAVSSVHCSLFLGPDGFFVVDLLGRGGTRVDEQPVRCEQLRDGSILGVGEYAMRVCIDDSNSAGPAASAPVDVSAAQVVPGTEFHKAFRLECAGNVEIVTLLGDATRFHYADVHRESNTARWILHKPEISHVVIDFGGGDVFSSVSIASVVALARTATDQGGKAILCNVTERTLDVLRTMHLTDVWPCVETRAEAFRLLNA